MKLLKLLILCSLFMAVPAMARMAMDMAMPEPPADNPHPPQTEADKKRVAFAELALQTLLKQEYPQKPNSTSSNEAASVAQYVVVDDGKNQKLALSESCLRSKDCLAAREDARTYIQGVRKSVGGALSEFRHAHIIPWSWEAFQKNAGVSTTYQLPGKSHKPVPGSVAPMSPTNVAPNEYIVHIYVLFRSGGWHHVDVILTEDAGQGIRFNRFFIIQIPSSGGDLPPGTVC